MLIRPLRPPAGTGSEPVPAWQAVQQTMPQRAEEDCWLITQTDHAKLAGEIAAQLTPRLHPAAVEAIARHDAGWKLLDKIPPPANEAVVSFFYVRPRAAGRAWIVSIDEAEARSPLAGLMVSGHFFRLASERARANAFSGEDAAALQDFLSHESERQERLRKMERRSQAEVERLIDVLQFCDLLSLYLCCGAQMRAVFPQPAPAAGIVIRPEGSGFALEPSCFPQVLRLAVPAYRFGSGALESLAFRLM